MLPAVAASEEPSALQCQTPALLPLPVGMGVAARQLTVGGGGAGGEGFNGCLVAGVSGAGSGGMQKKEHQTLHTHQSKMGIVGRICQTGHE